MSAELEVTWVLDMMWMMVAATALFMILLLREPML